MADLFFLAMVHRRLGEKAQGRQYYEMAAGFMESNHPGSEQLRRFQSEAAALLDIAELGDGTSPEESPKACEGPRPLVSSD